jgi:hemerythrin superfamily protein
MSILEKVVAAVTPAESGTARLEARAKARASAKPGDWLSLVLDHHTRIEDAFAAVRGAPAAAARLTALKSLALILTGHSNAEESVIYPALARAGHKSHATAGYEEQAQAKVNMGELENLDPVHQEFLDKLEHIRSAVVHHMYEEEHDRFLDLKSLSARDQEQLTRRYKEEFERYMGDEATAEGRFGGVPGAAAR